MYTEIVSFELHVKRCSLVKVEETEKKLNGRKFPLNRISLKVLKDLHVNVYLLMMRVVK